jgi:hypothetical protein
MSEVSAQQAQDGTGAGLLGFLDWAGRTGQLSPGTAKSITVSVRRVLAIEADPDAVNVLELDPEDLFSRFETLNRTNYTPESMSSYKSRFLNAVAMYQAWLDKRPDWKTAGGWGRRSAKGATRTARENGGTSRKGSRAKPPAASEDASSGGHQPGTPMVPYDLPLRPGLRVRLVLPEVLTRADAERIAAFVSSLAFDQVDQDKGGE